ncbi:atlastin-2-like [Ciona intestinalis]
MMHNEERKCVSIVETSKGNTPEINLNLLEKILKNYQDHPVAIISVFGEHRTGKSFLLNNLCQYLLSNQSPYWYQENDRSLAKLFHWRAGTKPDTNEIHITDQPFMLKNNKGKNIAVFLMDTQGSFDKAINAKQCSIIFAWSTLLSSLQIYNLPGLIRENDLQHLGIFCHTQTLLENNKEEIPSRREPRIQVITNFSKNNSNIDFDTITF